MKIHKLTPNFEVKNIKETVKFYQSVLSFSLVMAVPATQDGIEQTLSNNKEYVYALVSKDNIEMMFQQTESFKKDLVFAKDIPLGASVSFYMDVEGLNNFYNEIKDKVEQITEPKSTWYGMQEFYIKDVNGYILGFAEKSK